MAWTEVSFSLDLRNSVRFQDLSVHASDEAVNYVAVQLWCILYKLQYWYKYITSFIAFFVHVCVKRPISTF